MKKITSFVLALVLMLSAIGCGAHTHDFVLSESKSTPVGCFTDGLEVKICACGERTEQVIKSTGHVFVLSEEESKPVKCEKDGLEVKICSCGERTEQVLAATGHDMKVTSEIKAGCGNPGSIDYKCSICNKKEYQFLPATGHAYADPTEPSRVIPCTNVGCKDCAWTEPNNKYEEVLTFHFTKEDEAAIDAKYEEVLALLNAAPKYDPALHGYAEDGALAEEYERVDAIHTELYDLIMNALSQEQLAQIEYYCNMKNSELEKTYSYMMEYKTAVIAKFYTLSRPFYDSCYRDFYYYGMTEEEINAFLFDSDALSNPEYTALKDRNSAIEIEFLALENPEKGDELPILYAEFAENNNKMAQLMGYDNYLEYAYENVYDRAYTPEDAKTLAGYVKAQMSVVFSAIYQKWNSLSDYTAEDVETYYTQTSYSFFKNLQSNTLVNDYIDLMAFTTNPDKQISFSDEFNKLAVDGNLFRGQYEGAFVTTIRSANLPIAYFGQDYDTAFTIVHEFGHYMNEIYSAEISQEDPEFSQTYDLLEMHSQGNELLYLYYLKENAEMTDMAEAMIEIYTLVNMLYSIMAGMTIDVFEQAIYLNSYTGLGADMIMADGKITYDEYDLLYTNICRDFGVADSVDGYWRYGMTITSPCYYISYSVSALSVLQLYEIAGTQGFDAARDAYLNLFTYVDEDPNMSLEEIMAYAGLLSFEDEQLYINLRKYLLQN